MKIDWESSDNENLLNPRFPGSEQNDILEMLSRPPLRGHVWVATSGSNYIKWVALSKQALLCSAAAVNTILDSNKSDVWLNALPFFHVGGLGIYARCYLSQAKVIDGFSIMNGKWNANHFYQLLCEHQVSLTALVPTQIYDMVNLGLRQPSSLRAIIVGGGVLHHPLYQKAKDLGWHLLPSYGLTEASSQVATAELLDKTNDKPLLKILPHMEVMVDDAGHIKLKSPSLLTLYALKIKEGVEFIDPKKDGWFLTEDLGKRIGPYLEIQGRSSNFIKIGGESVDLSRLERIFDEEKLSANCPFDAVLVPISDPRLGYVVHMASNGSEKLLEHIVTAYQNRVLPFERIRKIHYVPTIPRSPTSKLLLFELKKYLKTH